ncbi:ribonuclease P protein subunit [Candidatus Woesearchaeota archaeon]|nr:ribonuclease P protein subunit [Candidatus Woesearchaeota archaeon]
MIRLLGKHIIVEAPGKTTEGEVVEETSSTVLVQHKDGMNTFIKHNSIFIIDGARVPGKDLVGRHDERLKKWLKKTR